MNEPFDFQVYFQKEEIQGYYGFIRPDGGFYRIRPKEWEDVFHTHNTWARAFIKQFELEKDDELTSSQTLIQKYQFILCSHAKYFDQDVDTFLVPNHDGVYLLHQLEHLSIPQEQLRTARIVASRLEDQHSKK